MQTLTRYEVGKRFPLEPLLQQGEVTKAIVNAAFFDVACVISNPTPKEIKKFRSGGYTVGVYDGGHVPFIIFHFDENFSFDAPIDLSKVAENLQDDWLNSKTNAVTLFLVDAATGILKGQRMVGLPPEIGDTVRNICEKQLQEEVDADVLITQAYQTVSTKEMLKRSVIAFHYYDHAYQPL
jgi:hypothetical protein